MKYTHIDKLPLFLNVSDVAEIMNISKNKAYELFHQKNFPSIILGRRMLIPKLAFIKWMECPTHK